MKTSDKRFYRLSVTFRVLCAVIGGYAVAVLFATVISAVFPLSKVDGALLGMMLSFAIWVVFALCAFLIRKPRHVAMVFLVPLAVLPALIGFGGFLGRGGL